VSAAFRPPTGDSRVQNLIGFFKESYEELKRVTWLTKKEMVASTWLVLLVVIVMSIYVGVIDLIIARTFGLLV
jgi:preprotein translocase subunit SecE